MKRAFLAVLVSSLVLAPLPVGVVHAQASLCGNGPFVDFANETITVSTTAVGLTASVYAPTDPPKATRAIIAVNTNNVRYWPDGSAPTTSAGIILQAGQTVEVCSLSLNKFRMIRDDSSDAEVAAAYSGPQN